MCRGAEATKLAQREAATCQQLALNKVKGLGNQDAASMQIGTHRIEWARNINRGLR